MIMMIAFTTALTITMKNKNDSNFWMPLQTTPFIPPQELSPVPTQSSMQSQSYIQPPHVLLQQLRHSLMATGRLNSSNNNSNHTCHNNHCCTANHVNDNSHINYCSKNHNNNHNICHGNNSNANSPLPRIESHSHLLQQIIMEYQARLSQLISENQHLQSQNRTLQTQNSKLLSTNSMLNEEKQQLNKKLQQYDTIVQQKYVCLDEMYERNMASAMSPNGFLGDYPVDENLFRF